MADPRDRLQATDEEWKALQRTAAANPRPSALLEALENDEPVIVKRSALSREFVQLQRFPGAPEWTRDPFVQHVRVTPEDVLIPVNY